MCYLFGLKSRMTVSGDRLIQFVLIRKYNEQHRIIVLLNMFQFFALLIYTCKETPQQVLIYFHTAQIKYWGFLVSGGDNW